MKDFKKMSNTSDWVTLVKYELTASEAELRNKEEKTAEDFASLKAVFEKFEAAPSAEETKYLNKAYADLCTKNNLSQEDFKLQGAHITIENDKIRGVMNLITIEDNTFKRLLF